MIVNTTDFEEKYGKKPEGEEDWLVAIDGTNFIFAYKGTIPQIKKMAEEICRQEGLNKPEEITILKIYEIQGGN